MFNYFDSYVGLDYKFTLPDSYGTDARARSLAHPITIFIFMPRNERKEKKRKEKKRKERQLSIGVMI